jgi:hypothetical protein
VFRSEWDLERAVESKNIVRKLPIVDQVRIERELRDIHRLLQTRQPVMLEQRLRAGRPLRIVSGSLAGMCGQVVKKAGGTAIRLATSISQPRRLDRSRRHDNRADFD